MSLNNPILVMRFYVIFFFGLILFSCKNAIQQKLINEANTLWRISHSSKLSLDSSNIFYRFHSNKLDEVMYFDNEFKKMNSNPDIINWQKWNIVNDSIIRFSWSDHKILELNDSIAVFLNMKRTTDTLFLRKILINWMEWTQWPTTDLTTMSAEWDGLIFTDREFQ